MGGEQKVGLIKNVRKIKWANVLYWTFFYAYTFMIASKWFVYEDGVLSLDFSLTAFYQHVALLSSIIIGFAFLRRHTYVLPKRIMSVIASVAILFGGIFASLRSNLVYLVLLSVLLGQLADCSLLTYIYEMNNSERLFGIVFCHILSALVGVFSVSFDRTTSAYWFLVFALSAVSAVTSFLEKKDVEWQFTVAEVFQKKLYVPLILACIGGIVAVCSSMVTISETAKGLPMARYFYFGGAILGALVYFVEYRFMPRAATATLVTGFATAVVCIFCFVLSSGATLACISAVFGGMTFNICMMNLYFILCTIIKKYRDSKMFRIAPIVSNFAGIVIVAASTFVVLYASEIVIKIGLSVCLLGNVVVLATSLVWDKGISITAKQEEYLGYDTVITKEQIYQAAGLTEKESEIADLLLENLSLKEIAARLFISENTAKTHRSAVYKKLQVGSKDELVEKMKNVARAVV